MEAIEACKTLNIGVLAIQGGFAEHVSHLHKAIQHLSKDQWNGKIKVTISEVRKAEELNNLDGLILPGGESTTISVFLELNGSELLNALKTFTSSKTTYGTCAGLILLANFVEGQKKDGQFLIGGFDATVSRNSYGTQLQSFESAVDFQSGMAEFTSQADFNIPVLFIRAPRILKIDDSKVKILGQVACQDGTRQIVGIEQNHLMATTFHPELTEELRWHEYFLLKALKEKSE